MGQSGWGSVVHEGQGAERATAVLKRGVERAAVAKRGGGRGGERRALTVVHKRQGAEKATAVLKRGVGRAAVAKRGGGRGDERRALADVR